jgi:hypothetical protein
MNVYWMLTMWHLNNLNILAYYCNITNERHEIILYSFKWENLSRELLSNLFKVTVGERLELYTQAKNHSSLGIVGVNFPPTMDNSFTGI